MARRIEARSWAWLNERTNTPFKSIIYALSLIPLVIPSVLFSVAWILLASPRIGLINQALQGWLGLEQPPFNIHSIGGMVWVDGLHDSPMAFGLDLRDDCLHVLVASGWRAGME